MCVCALCRWWMTACDDVLVCTILCGCGQHPLLQMPTTPKVKATAILKPDWYKPVEVNCVCVMRVCLIVWRTNYFVHLALEFPPSSNFRLWFLVLRFHCLRWIEFSFSFFFNDKENIRYLMKSVQIQSTVSHICEPWVERSEVLLWVLFARYFRCKKSEWDHSPRCSQDGESP